VKTFKGAGRSSGSGPTAIGGVGQRSAQRAVATVSVLVMVMVAASPEVVATHRIAAPRMARP